jgi:hypothetical protein
MTVSDTMGFIARICLPDEHGVVNLAVVPGEASQRAPRRA